MKLTTDQIEQITLATMLGMPQPFLGKASEAYRAALRKDMALAKKNGWIIELPPEWQVGDGDFVAPHANEFHLLGGPGSGNFGHTGRPGEVGGSGPGSPGAKASTIKGTIVSGLNMGKSTGEILAYVKKHFPDSHTTAACVSWYKSKIKAEGAGSPGKPVKAKADGMFVDYYDVLGNKTGTKKIGNAKEAKSTADSFNAGKPPPQMKMPFIQDAVKTPEDVKPASVPAFTPPHASTVVPGASAGAYFTGKSASPSALTARSAATMSILSSGVMVKDAVLSLPNNEAARQTYINSIGKGKALSRAQVEYKDTPLCDLEVLTSIEVADKPVHGQAHCTWNRQVVMGSTSVTGDFRHELGHALHMAASKEMQTQMEALHAESMKRFKDNPPAQGQGYSHEFYEVNYGVIGRRALDTWHEDVAEHYRGYHKAVWQSKGENPKALTTYRERFPEWTALWDSWYTAALSGKGRKQ